MTEREFKIRVIPLRHLMYGVALRMGIPPDDAADIVQETLIRLWHRKELIPKGTSELKLYCLASSRNECLTRIRLKKHLEPLEEASIQNTMCFDDLESNETINNIEQMIEKLPESQRKAIKLRAFGDFETSEIAEVMGESEMNVRQLISRARKKLREMMDKLEKTK